MYEERILPLIAAFLSLSKLSHVYFFDVVFAPVRLSYYKIVEL